MRKFKLNPIYPCKTSWDYSKKEESNSYINNLQSSFHMLDLKKKHFLNLIDNNLDPIIPMYIKGGS